MLVNGEELEVEGAITVEELLKKLKLKNDKVVVEVDFEIVDKAAYDKKTLNTSSKVEIIRFVGGG